LLGAGRVFDIDTLPDRLAKANELGAEIIDFNKVLSVNYFSPSSDN
jgi:threonine dehydrogenase-like Zn-dependent dehydrogenase